MSDFEDRLAEALRHRLTCGIRGDSPADANAVAVLAEYDATRRKPDAAERAADYIIYNIPELGPKQYPFHLKNMAEVIRSEYAKDNAERDARDREREEEVQMLCRQSVAWAAPYTDLVSAIEYVRDARTDDWPHAEWAVVEALIRQIRTQEAVDAAPYLRRAFGLEK